MPDHQGILDKCYDRWQKSDPMWPMEEFWEQLDPEEYFAVMTGKLNQQVENGGFLQWYDNQYGTAEIVNYLIETLPRLNTVSCMQVVELLRQYKEAVEMRDEWDEEDDRYENFSGNVEPLDTAYYAINEQFMRDVQEALNKGTWRDPHNPHADCKPDDCIMNAL